MGILVKNIAIRLFSFALIVVMGCMAVNKGMYTHTHTLDGGRVFTHAHPYNKTNDKEPSNSHRHTKAEFLFYASLTTLFYSFSAVTVLLLLCGQIKLFSKGNETYFKRFFHEKSGRSPPFLRVYMW